MKKTFTILLMSLFGMGVFAQCPLTEAIDFTATDVHGTEWNLFDVLDGGQYVCIDFFLNVISEGNRVYTKPLVILD